MKTIQEKVYLSSPVILQNIVATLYGLQAKLIRHGGNYKQYFSEVRTRATITTDELKDYVNLQLQKILLSASMTPYYRQLFNDYGINVHNIKTIEELWRIPLLEKEIIRYDPQQLINTSYPVRKLLTLYTTGTTATPLRIYCNYDIRQKNYAFFDSYLSSVGIDAHSKRATFWGRVIVPIKQRKPPFWRYSLFQRNLLFSSYHLTEYNIPFYIDKLRSYQPHYIDAYPSSIYTIARYSLEKGIDLANITNGITTSAETLFPWQREAIQNAFGVNVYDQYGSAEMCVFIGQCCEGCYHVRTDYGIVEFLHEDGSSALPGEEAEIVCTGLINYVMPLIRYKIGDRGVLSASPCPCGSPYPVMHGLVGRVDDVIITPDGRRIGRMSPVLKGFPVKEGQYIQDALDSVVIRLVKADGYTEKTEENICNELRKRLGQDMRISFKYYDVLPRGPGGKLRTVISCIPKTP